MLVIWEKLIGWLNGLIVRWLGFPIVQGNVFFSNISKFGGYNHQAIKPSNHFEYLCRMRKLSMDELNRKSVHEFKEAEKIAKSMEAEKGATSALFQKNIDYMLANIYLGMNNCNESKLYLDKSSNVANNKFLFNPSQQIPTGVGEGYIYYYIQCEKNVDEANYYLELFLREKMPNPLEKARIENKFNLLKEKYVKN